MATQHVRGWKSLSLSLCFVEPVSQCLRHTAGSLLLFIVHRHCPHHRHHGGRRLPPPPQCWEPGLASHRLVKSSNSELRLQPHLFLSNHFNDTARCLTALNKNETSHSPQSYLPREGNFLVPALCRPTHPSHFRASLKEDLPRRRGQALLRKDP